MSEEINRSVGGEFAEARLLAALQDAYDKVEPCKSHQHWGIASGPAYRDGRLDGERSGFYQAMEIVKRLGAANTKLTDSRRE